MRWKMPALLLIFTISGCVSLPPLSEHKSRHRVPLRGSFTPESVQQVDALLDVLPQRMVEAINSISINDDEHHYWSANHTGHCHWPSRHICIKSGKIEGSLWHETAHAYAYYLDDIGSNFYDDWRHAAGNVYGKHSPAHFPSAGLLSKYGATNYDEDISVFVEEFYCAITGRGTFFATVAMQSRAAKRPPDARFQKKVDLLLKYGFISKEHYEKFKQLKMLDP